MDSETSYTIGQEYSEIANFGEMMEGYLECCCTINQTTLEAIHALFDVKFTACFIDDYVENLRCFIEMTNDVMLTLRCYDVATESLLQEMLVSLVNLVEQLIDDMDQ
jgi:hypothetical protein